MKSINWRVVLGGLLLFFGVIGVLQAFNVLSFEGLWWGLFFGVVFAVAGGAFLYVTIKDRSNWWAVIPGFTLLGIGLTILSSTLLPDAWGGRLGGMFVLGFIGLSFWIIYFMSRERWWAIIPGGVMVTLAVITVIEDSAGMVVPALLFLGIGATFALLALLPTGEGRKVWPWYPAGACLLLGTVFALTEGSWLNYVWPAVLMVVGVYLIIRTMLKR